MNDNIVASSTFQFSDEYHIKNAREKFEASENYAVEISRCS